MKILLIWEGAKLLMRYLSAPSYGDVSGFFTRFDAPDNVCVINLLYNLNCFCLWEQ